MLADLRHAWRAIRAMPVVSIVVVGSLGVGIGVNTAVFSWMQAVVFRPLPGVAGASTFRQIEPRADTRSDPRVSWREYPDLRQRLPSMPDLIAFRMVPFNFGARAPAQRAFG